jgi:hypothetical protein
MFARIDLRNRRPRALATALATALAAALGMGAIPAVAQELPPTLGTPGPTAPTGQQQPAAPTEGVPAAAQPAIPDPPPFAILDVTVHSMQPGSSAEVVDVWIEGRRVRALGPDLEIPAGVETIDGSGKHLVPGLIDAMVSFDPNHDLLYVSHGVTSVRDMGSIPRLLQAIREPGNRERSPGPAVLSAGAVLDGSPASSPSAVGIADENELIAAVTALAGQVGADFLSVQPRFPAELLPQLGEQARGVGLPIWMLLDPAMEMDTALEAGVRGFLGLDVLLPKGIEWSVIQPPALRSKIDRLAASGGALVPVVSQAQRNLKVEDPNSPELELLDFFYVSQWMQDWQLRQSVLNEEFLRLGQRIAKKRRTVLLNLIAAGVTVLPGSGAPLSWVMPGRSLIDELDCWVEAGVAPLDALDHATRIAAQELRLTGRGLIIEDAVADLVLLDSDPRASLAGLRDPAAVIVRGNLLERPILKDRLNSLAMEHNRVKAERRQPLAIVPPELPDGDPVLAGQIETWDAYGNRLASERFAMVRETDGAISVVGRMVQPVAAGQPETQVETAQRVVNGRLHSFVVRLSQGENSLVARGVEVGGMMRVERKLNGEYVANQSTEQALALWSLDPLVDSVTSALVLGQIEEPGEQVVFMAGPQLEPVLDVWAMLDDEEGARWVRFADGFLAIEFDERGFPQRISRRFGAGTDQASSAVTISTLVPGSERTFGGPGWPAKAVYRPADGEEQSVEAGAPAGDPPAPDAGSPTDEAPETTGDEGSEGEAQAAPAEVPAGGVAGGAGAGGQGAGLQGDGVQGDGR